MTDVLRDEFGQAIFICGFAAVFNELRAYYNDRAIRPWAFDGLLRDPDPSIDLQFHHMGDGFSAGNIADDTLRIWVNAYGVAFECGPLEICSKNVSFVNLIARGEIRGASWSGTLQVTTGEIIRISSLDHLACVAYGAYEGAACWLSSEHYDDLPRHLKAKAEIWATGRGPYDARRLLKKMSCRVAKLPRRAPASRVAPSRPQARTPTRRPVSLPLSVRELYPAIPGLSSAEQAKAAFEERKLIRSLKRLYPNAPSRSALLAGLRGASAQRATRA